MYRRALLCALIFTPVSFAQVPATVVNQFGPAKERHIYRCGFDVALDMLREKQRLEALTKKLLERAFAADGIDGLRRSQRWDMTELVLSLYDAPGHGTPATEWAILCFALQSPAPAARDFVRQREQDHPWIQQIRKALDREELFR